MTAYTTYIPGDRVAILAASPLFKGPSVPCVVTAVAAVATPAGAGGRPYTGTQVLTLREIDSRGTPCGPSFRIGNDEVTFLVPESTTIMPIGTVTLVAGSATVALTGVKEIHDGDTYDANRITQGDAPGFISIASSDNTLTVTSSSNTDTGELALYLYRTSWGPEPLT